MTKLRIILDTPSSLLINETEIVVPEEKAWLIYVEAVMSVLEFVKVQNDLTSAIYSGDKPLKGE